MDNEADQTATQGTIQPKNRIHKITSKISIGKLKKLPKIAYFAIFLILFLVATSGYFYFKSLNTTESSAEREISKETQKIISELEKLVTLPQDETPRVATVNEVEKLREQPFFRNAQNGDKVVIYQSSNRAYLFDPVEKKVKEVSTISATASQNNNVEQVAGEKTQNPTFTILNSTTTAGLANKYKTEVESKIESAQVTNVGNSVSENLPKTIIIAAEGQDATALAATLGIEAATLPNGEQTPSTNFLIILGIDKASI